MTEIDRIVGVPQVDFEGAPSDLTRVMTQFLKTQGGAQELRPWQARALEWAHDYEGLWVEADLGAGKTLLGFLIPVVCDLARPLMIVPAALRKDTYTKFRQAQIDWRVQPFELLSYSEISCDRENELLDRIKPDGIIFDEVHMLSSLNSGRTRKLRRWIEEHRPRCYAMTGTPYTRTVGDVAHIMDWCLGDNSPYPRHRPTLYRWCQATDPDANECDRKMAAGIAQLRRLPGAETDTWLDRIRNRVRTTPGVAWVGDLYDGPLTIRASACPYSPSASMVSQSMSELGIRPDGEPIEDGLEMWRHSQELWFGYWGRWDPPPPTDWRLARRAWCRFVREALELDTECDTPMAIANAIDRLDPRFAAGVSLLRDWRAVRPDYEINPVPEWVDRDAPIYAHAAEWLDTHPNGLIWISHVPASVECARALGLPYFGAGQGDPGVPCIEDHDGPAVLSVDANVLGRNLQHKWWENLVLGPPSCGVTLNQLIGRTHRTEQQRKVIVDIISPPGDKSLDKAIKSSRFIGRLKGAETKLERGLEK